MYVSTLLADDTIIFLYLVSYFLIVFLPPVTIVRGHRDLSLSVYLSVCSSRYSTELPGRVAQSVGHPTRKSGVLGSIPGLATYFRFSFRFFKKGSCQLLAKVCARSTG